MAAAHMSDVKPSFERGEERKRGGRRRGKGVRERERTGRRGRKKEKVKKK